MKLLAATIASILFLVSPATAQQLCGSRDDVVASLAKNFDEHPVARGLGPRGAMVEVFASESGSFTFVWTRPGGSSCLTDAGDNWEILPLPKWQESTPYLPMGSL